MSHQKDFSGNKVAENYQQHKIYELEKLAAGLIVDVILEDRKVKNEKSFKHLDLLDVGCGNGGVTRRLATHFGHAIGVDFSPDQIQKAKASDNADNVEFRVGVAEDLPVASNSIDVITAFYSLHFTNVEEFVNECKRVLKPGGMAVFYGDCMANVSSTECAELPDTADQIQQMYAKYSEIAQLTSHPEFHLIDHYRTLYESIAWTEKSMVDTNLMDIVLSLHDIYHHLMSIPFYRMSGTTCGVPLAEYVQTVKSMWAMNEVNDRNIMIRVSHRAFAIILSE